MKTLLLGDLCPTEYNANLFAQGDINTLFSDTVSLFANNDLTLVNLECALTESEHRIKKFGPNLKAPVETTAVMNALGIEEHANPLGMYHKVTHSDEHPEISVFRTLSGPNCVKHRYLTADCECGAAILLSFAKRLGIEMPVLKAFVDVAGIITEEDYMANGRTLENLGFGPEMSIEEIMAAV